MTLGNRRQVDVQGAGDAYRVHGQLTIRGITKPVTLEVEKDGVATDPWGNQKIALTARTTIDRTQWGLTWNAPRTVKGSLVQSACNPPLAPRQNA